MQKSKKQTQQESFGILKIIGRKATSKRSAKKVLITIHENNVLEHVSSFFQLQMN